MWQVAAPCNVAGGSTLQCGRWLWGSMPWNWPKRPPYWISTSGFEFDHIMGSPKRLTGSASIDSCDAASTVATVCKTLLHLPNSVRLWMNNYLICHNQNHVLYSFLQPPSTASQNYHLRQRAHSQQLPQHTGHLTDSNFITRMLFTDIY